MLSFGLEFAGSHFVPSMRLPPTTRELSTVATARTHLLQLCRHARILHIATRHRQRPFKPAVKCGPQFGAGICKAFSVAMHWSTDRHIKRDNVEAPEPEFSARYRLALIDAAD